MPWFPLARCETLGKPGLHLPILRLFRRLDFFQDA